MPFPLRALLLRMEGKVEGHPWSQHLPQRLSSAAQSPSAAPAPSQAQAPPMVAFWMQSAEHGQIPVLALQPLQSVQPAGVFLQVAPASSVAGQCSACGSCGNSCQPVPSCVSSIAGRVWSLSQDAQGCRQVQLALEMADEGSRMAIASELRGHVFEAMRCPHANHVAQKVIMLLRPGALQFIIDEILVRPVAVSQAARHKYGCRIVQRLLESCKPDQVRGLVQILLADARAIACHPYGNYVMQHLLRHGCEEDKGSLIQVLLEHLATLTEDSYGCAVISAAMQYASAVDQRSIASFILQVPNLLAALAQNRHGHLAAQKVPQVLDGQERATALQIVSTTLEAQKRTRPGAKEASGSRQSKGLPASPTHGGA